MSTNPNPRPTAAGSDLRERLRGDVLRPDNDGYDEAREIWNAMIDREPAVVVRAAGAADVMETVPFAREHDLEIAIKGGGHNVAGDAVCDDGLVLDLSSMNEVHVDPIRQTARVGPGAVLHDLDGETQAHGLATPAGFISTTGVAGLTLGGGVGYLSRKHGLTVDNLLSVDLVTADGEFVRASANENPDLFWAVRGGGGNFGVVTSFEFELHELGPTVEAGPVVWPFEDARAVLREAASFMRDAPDEVSCLPILRHAPPAPFLPESVHGELVLLIAMIYAGDPEEGARELQPLSGLGDPIGDALGPKPYTAFQSMFDDAVGPGARNYWKSHYLDDLTGDCIDVFCDYADRMTSPDSAIGMLSLGGKVARKPHDATPYPHREATWVVNIQSRWHEPDEDERHVEWTRELFEAIAPFSTGGVYVNFMSEDEGDERVRAAYGEAIYERLATVKTEWDPQNVFHLNQNISPAN
ncbi:MULTISPECIES: FAD-binding oxidoreductase [unclassified Natrinema]|uniref:FAD-binding oxidoreductase n=1 Tax=unclassified Natrinema TaxID=2622230 RepID=UPI00026D49D5|nr:MULTISPECIES: FAD-binding oxidoreductase [unclassified Natrinema]AFO58531.1 FAD linked oxidase domain-containing protein [Natrinema sp. J7-2]